MSLSDEPRIQALLSAIVLFRLISRGFAHADLKAQLALLLGVQPETITGGRMTYDFRRLRLHGGIRRLP